MPSSQDGHPEHNRDRYTGDTGSEAHPKSARLERETMLKEFREFAVRGNVVDLAVGVIVGAAFGKIVSSFVDDLIMPLVGLLFQADYSNLFIVLKPGKTEGTLYNTLAAAKADGAATLNYGLFLSTVLNFVIVAFAIFLVVKAINKLRREPAPQPAAAPAPTKDQELLAEIRDLLKSR